MNVEIGAEAVLFPEKEYIKGIFLAVHKKWKLVYEEKNSYEKYFKNPYDFLMKIAGGAAC
jgi:hypothetical protein